MELLTLISTLCKKGYLSLAIAQKRKEQRDLAMFRASWAESKENKISCNTHRRFFLNSEIFGGIISCRNKSEQTFLGFVSLKSVHLPSRLVSHHALWPWWVDWEDFQPQAWSLIQFELTLIEHISAARAERGGRCHEERQQQNSVRAGERSLSLLQVGAVSTLWHGPPVCLACSQLSYMYQPSTALYAAQMWAE